MENEKLMIALKLIKAECKKSVRCEKCSLYHEGSDENCFVLDTIPEEWEFKDLKG